jgi:hypothetical protein
MLADAALADLVAVLRRCSKRPTDRWRGRAAQALTDSGDEGVALVRGLVEAAATDGQWDALATPNGDLVRGAIYAYTELLEDPVAPLTAIARRAGRAAPGAGVAPNPKVAAAALLALGHLGTFAAGQALAALDGEIRHRGLMADVATAMREAAGALGLTVDDLGDAVVLDDPAALAAHLDAQMGEGRLWAAKQWRAQFIDHPVAGKVGRSLVWSIGEETILGAEAPAALDGSVTARLWHPAEASEEEVARWQHRLASLQTTQPLKQIAREVFRLAPDDPGSLYTTRFAGASVRNRQMTAMGKTRNWFSSTAGYWSPDAGGCSYRDFRAGEWRVTLFVDVVGTGYEHATADVVTIDQLHFARYDAQANGWRIAPLGDVPPAVLSEALRDVALFTEVGRVGSDETWRDRGTLRYAPRWPSTAWIRSSFLEVPMADGGLQRLHAPLTAPPRAV